MIDGASHYILNDNNHAHDNEDYKFVYFINSSKERHYVCGAL